MLLSLRKKKLILSPINSNDQNNSNYIDVLDSNDIKAFLKRDKNYQLVDVNLIDQKNQNSNDSSITLLLTFKPESPSNNKKEKELSVSFLEW